MTTKNTNTPAVTTRTKGESLKERKAQEAQAAIAAKLREAAAAKALAEENAAAEAAAKLTAEEKAAAEVAAEAATQALITAEAAAAAALAAQERAYKDNLIMAAVTKAHLDDNAIFGELMVEDNNDLGTMCEWLHNSGMSLRNLDAAAQLLRDIMAYVEKARLSTKLDAAYESFAAVMKSVGLPVPTQEEFVRNNMPNTDGGAAKSKRDRGVNPSMTTPRVAGEDGGSGDRKARPHLYNTSNYMLPQHPGMAVPCRTCAAAPHQKCVSTGGYTVRGHSPRVNVTDADATAYKATGKLPSVYTDWGMWRGGK